MADPYDELLQDDRGPLDELYDEQLGFEPTIETDVYYYHPDHLGNTGYVTQVFGEVSQHVEYFAFGETFLEEHNNTTDRTPYLFNAKEQDEETGLYYYGARYYDPVVSNWLSVDPPVVGKFLNGVHNGGVYNSFNLGVYNYVYQNPIVLKDLDGNQTNAIKPMNNKADRLYREYYSSVSQEEKAGLDALNLSSRIYKIYVGSGKSGTTIKSGEYNLYVTSAGKYTIGILADELTHASQIESGDIGYDGNNSVLAYDLQDEVDSKIATIKALGKKGLKLQDSKKGYLSKKFGELYDQTGGNPSWEQIQEWANIKHPKEKLSYADIIKKSRGSMKEGVRTKISYIRGKASIGVRLQPPMKLSAPLLLELQD